MAVIISNGNVNLSAANGFYRVEAHNLMPLNIVVLGISTPRYIPVTFANAGNCKGLGLILQSSNTDFGVSIDLLETKGTTTVTIANPCVVTFNSHGLADGSLVEFSTTGALPTGLTAGIQYYVRNGSANSFNLSTTPAGALVVTSGTQSGTHTLHAVRANNTSTYAQVINGTTTNSAWLTLTVPFEFGTPYAVDATPAKWRFKVSQSGGTVGAWYLETSDGTNACYFTWCDTAVSFNASDTLICKDIVTIDQTCTFGSVLGTGEATDGVSIVVCRCKVDPTPANVSNLVWQNPPAASYTMTLSGHMILGAWAGFRVGTSTARIAKSVQAVIVWGSQGMTVYRNGAFSNDAAKSSLFLYGEYPTIIRTALASQANAGQRDLVTTDITGWAVGDTIAIGRQNTTGFGDQSQYTINTIAGTNINLTGNIATNNRMAGGAVVNLSAYGIWMYPTANTLHTFKAPSNFIMDGVRLGQASFGQSFNVGGVLNLDDSANTLQYRICNLSVVNQSVVGFLVGQTTPVKGFLIDNVASNAGRFTTVGFVSYGRSGALTISNTVLLANRSGGGFMLVLQSNNRGTVINNLSIENTDSYFAVAGYELTMTGCHFWGGSLANGGIVSVGALVNTLNWSGNYFDKNVVGLNFGGAFALNCVFSDDKFGTIAANTNDINFEPGNGLFIAEVKSPTNTPLVDLTYISTCIPSSRLAITDANDTANVDKDYKPDGNIIRTGFGLTDTTTYTAGSGRFGMCFAPSNTASGLLKWTQTIPTGNIQSKAMSVGVWVKINNAAYYAGTHTKPTLRVTYDNGTAVTSVALGHTDWQLLQVSFTPSTTYGQITVQVEGATDATGTNAYFYVDDMVVNYPAGYVLSLGGLDLWAGGLPVAPAISTGISANDVWASLQATDYGAGTMGTLLKEVEKIVNDNQGLILGK